MAAAERLLSERERLHIVDALQELKGHSPGSNIGQNTIAAAAGVQRPAVSKFMAGMSHSPRIRETALELLHKAGGPSERIRQQLALGRRPGRPKAQ